MKITKKIFLLSALTLLLAANVSAQENTMLPDNPFYSLKMVIEQIETFFKSFGSKEVQVKHNLTLAEERLNEAKSLSDKGKTSLAKKTLEKHTDLVTQAELNAIEITENQKKARVMNKVIEKKESFSRKISNFSSNVRSKSVSVNNSQSKISLVSAARLKYGLFFDQARKECVNSSGKWIAENDWVGCIGVGLNDCQSHPLFAEAFNLCHKLGGKVNCSSDGIYCKR